MPTFARDHTRHVIWKRVEALSRGYRQNIGIVGPLGLGKSHLLKTIFHECCTSPDVICIYLPAEAFDFEQLVDRWTGAVLSGFLYSRSQRMQSGDLREVLSLCEPLIPKTVQAAQGIRRLLRKEKREDMVRELFALSGILAEEAGKKILFMLDEFHEIDKLPVSDPFAAFGREIMVEKDTLYLVSSSKPERAREIFRDKLSLLFGNFEVIELKPFAFQETVDFLDYHFPNTEFSREQRKFFISLTNGEPLYLDLLIDRLKFYLNPETDQIVSDHLIFTAFHEELFDRRGRIALIFEKLLAPVVRSGKDHIPYLRTLIAVSEANHKLPAIASYIGRRQSETKKILQKLVQEDRLTKKGSFYIHEDPLFRFWLREVFKRRNSHYFPEERRMSEEFHEILREHMERIRHEEKKDTAISAERLFKEFRNDVVETGTRKLRCPQFQEVVFRPANGRYCTLMGKSARHRWICMVASHVIEEEDVLAFVEEIRRLRKRAQKKIMVALEDMDQNARLMAQAHNIIIWGLRDFNALLELYDLPKVIRFSHSSVAHEAAGATS